MRVRFRPLLGLSIATGIAFAILVGLGVWQIERLQWKLALIASVERNLRASPIPLARALAMGSDTAQYRRVTLEGRFVHEKEGYVYATDSSGSPVFHVITPFFTRNGALLVDRGIVPPALKDPKTRPLGEVAGDMRVIGVWRGAEGPGLFTPQPDLPHRTWYARDAAGIARADGIRPIAPAIVESDSTPNPGGWPKGGQTAVTFRNEHLQYAITWFLMAAALAAVYFAYHRARGRLTFS